jgi:hypothetical protein
MVSRILNHLAEETSKGDAKRMIYKGFDKHITRKHGIVIEGWPLGTFDNPSSIGSQLELKVLLNAWQTGATRFRKMNDKEHMAWVENHADSEGPSPLATHPPSPSLPLPGQLNGQDPASPITPEPQAPFNVIHFEPSTTSPPTNNTPKPKRPRKARSDKGKPRKKPSQVPGVATFHTNTL